MVEKETLVEAHKDDGYWSHNIYDGEKTKHKSLAAAKEHALDGEAESVIHHVSGGKIQKTHREKASGNGWESHTEHKGKTIDHDDLHEAAVDTLKPGAGSGGTESKAVMLSTFTTLLAQLGKEDLSQLFNDVQAQFGPNKAPGATDNAASNRATVDMKPSAAVGKGAWKEDIDDMFSGDDLSEEFRERVETVFEAAVNARTNIEAVRLQEAFDELETELEEAFEVALEEQTGKIFEDVASKLDQYLDYVVEQWMEDNQIAIDQGLRLDIAENFMQGLHNLFAEHYITVPDEKIDLVAEMKAENDQLKAMLNEVVDNKLELEAVINEATKEATLEEVSEGLAETQIEKLRTLAEGIDYTDATTYRKKLEIVKENYFTARKPSTSTGLITEEIDGSDSDVRETVLPQNMQMYATAISKSAK